MKILFSTDTFLPHAGGARVYYYNLYKSLVVDFGDDVTILTRKVPGWRAFDKEERSPQLRIVRRSRPLDNWRWHQWPKVIPALLETLAMIVRYRPDAIHFGDLFPQGIVCLFLRKIFGFRYLAYCHGEEITQTDRRRYQPHVRDAIYRNAEIVIAASEFARENLIRIGIPESQIQKVNPGVDCDRFRPGQKNPALMDKFSLHGKRVLLTVSRLVPRKGHSSTLRAIAGLLAGMPDLRYLIVGAGPERERLTKEAEALGIAHAVHFAGFVPERELPDYYNLCDVFVLVNSAEASTGDIEGFGMVFIEANASGKPVIAGKSGGTAESVAHGITGYRVDPTSMDEIRTALESLLSDGALRERLGANGLARARAEFSWIRSAAALHSAIETPPGADVTAA